MPKKLLNGYEALVNERLRTICEDCEAHVFPKVRIADVLSIEGSGIDSERYRFALQAHFDFVVTDAELVPLFAVEFDGPSHRGQTQVERDRKKDALCEAFQFPLLRINARYLTTSARGMDLLTWLIETWFNARAFYHAQDEGVVPWDEGFTPWTIYSTGKKKNFPYHLGLEALNHLRSFHEQGRCRDEVPSHWIGEDQGGRLIGIGWLRITESHGVVIRTGMKAKDFGFYLSDLLDDLVSLETVSELEAVLSGMRSSISTVDMQKKIDQWTLGATLHRSGGVIDTLNLGKRTRFEM